jgi:hypothetical protein
VVTPPVILMTEAVAANADTIRVLLTGIAETTKLLPDCAGTVSSMKSVAAVPPKQTVSRTADVLVFVAYRVTRSNATFVAVVTVDVCRVIAVPDVVAEIEIGRPVTEPERDLTVDVWAMVRS